MSERLPTNDPRWDIIRMYFHGAQISDLLKAINTNIREQQKYGFIEARQESLAQELLKASSFAERRKLVEDAEKKYGVKLRMNPGYTIINYVGSSESGFSEKKGILKVPQSWFLGRE